MKKVIKEDVFELAGKSLFSRYIVMTISLLVSAMLYNFLISPTNLVIGGIPGLAVLNKEINNVAPSITIFVLSFIMLIFSYIFLGKERTRGSIYATVMYPILVYVTSFLTPYVQIDFSDLLIISIFIGIIMGISNGILYKTGFSNGGFPIISQILYKYFNISIGKSIFAINILIVLIGSLKFGTTMLMYVIIINFISNIIIDKILLGISKNKAVYILTSEKEKIKYFLINDMHHNATIFNVKGGFFNKKQELILTVIPTREYFELTESIKIIDPKVFYVVNDAYEVKGAK